MFVLYMTYSYPAIMAPFLLIGLRVWGSIILEMTEYVVVMLRAQYSQAKACSSVFVCLNFRLLKFRSTPGGSLRSIRPPAGLGFRV